MIRSKKLLLVAAAGVAVIMAVGYAVITSNTGQGGMRAPAAANSPTPNNISRPAEGSVAAGTYVNYTEDVIAQTSGTKVLFFHATWCQQCQAIEADIRAKGVPSGVTIIKVDYDSNQQLKKKYGVNLQTTLVRVDDSGGLVKKYVAYDEPNLSAIVRNLL